MNQRIASLMFGLLLTSAQAASAATFSFQHITNNSGGSWAAVENQVRMDVTANGATVDFKFYFQTFAVAMSITDIYFDDGTLLAISSITSSAGVSYDDPATPSNLPGANNASPAFVTTQGFSADSDAPVAANGVNAANEWVTINFTLQGGQTYADTLAALNSGALRVGLHVQAIGANNGGTGGNSESFVNTTLIPMPMPLAMASAGLLLLAGVSRRRLI